MIYFITKFQVVNSENYCLYLFSFLALLLLLAPFSDPKPLFVVFLFFTFLLWLKSKNLPFSFFLMTLFTLPFFEPNKYYVVEVLKSYERVPDINLGFRQGYFLGYGLIVSNLFAFFTLLLVIREIILSRFRKSVVRRFPLPFIAAPLFFWVGIYSSLNYSFFPELSITWLIQYLQMFIMAFFIVYFFINQRKQLDLIFPVIGVSVLFQVVVTLLQFFKQSSLGLAVEYVGVVSPFSTGLDEINTLLRPSGTFVQPNQMALIALCTLILVFVKALSSKNKFYLSLCFGCLSMIVISQSRAIWFATLVVFLVTCLYFRKRFTKVFRKLNIRRIAVYLFLLACPLLFVIVPRMILSTNFFEEGAGFPIRLEMIKEGLEAFSLSPFMGYGVGTNEYVLFSLFPDGVISRFPAPVHFAYLQFLLEVGVLGLTFFLLPFFYCLRRASQLKPKNLWLFPFLSGSLTFGVYYLFHPHAGIIEFPYLGLYLGFGLISIYLGGKNGNEKN